MLNGCIDALVTWSLHLPFPLSITGDSTCSGNMQ